MRLDPLELEVGLKGEQRFHDFTLEFQAAFLGLCPFTGSCNFKQVGQIASALDRQDFPRFADGLDATLGGDNLMIVMGPGASRCDLVNLGGGCPRSSRIRPNREAHV